MSAISQTVSGTAERSVLEVWDALISRSAAATVIHSEDYQNLVVQSTTDEEVITTSIRLTAAGENTGIALTQTVDQRFNSTLAELTQVFTGFLRKRKIRVQLEAELAGIIATAKGS